MRLEPERSAKLACRFGADHINIVPEVVDRCMHGDAPGMRLVVPVARDQ